jgi:hypothetical protein
MRAIFAVLPLSPERAMQRAWRGRMRILGFGGIFEVRRWIFEERLGEDDWEEFGEGFE